MFLRRVPTYNGVVARHTRGPSISNRYVRAWKTED